MDPDNFPLEMLEGAQIDANGKIIMRSNSMRAGPFDFYE